MPRPRRLRDDITFWLAVAAHLTDAAARAAARALRRLYRRSEAWVEDVRPAVEAATAEAAANARFAWRTDLPALRRRAAPPAGRLSAAARLRAPVAGTVAVVAVLGAWLLPGTALQVASLAAGTDLPRLHQRSVVLAADGSVLATLHRGADRRVVALGEMPSLLRRLVVLSEDRRFWDHGGYDGQAMARALVANVRAGEVVEGGSTITQQLAKLNFTEGSRSLARKAEELLHAVALERRWSKDELLERYLNQVYLGSGAHGVAAAAEEYFGVAPVDMTPAQSALLVGLIRAPVAFDPRRNPDEATRLRNTVLDLAGDAAILERAEVARLVAAPLDLVPPAPEDQPPVVDSIVRAFLADPAFGATREERARLLFTGGLTVRTTIDARLQRTAEELVSARRDAGLPGAAIAAVDPWTGEIRVLASAGPPEVESVDLAVQARRQPGSAMKPFVALAALEAGLAPDQRLAGNGPAAFRYGDRWWEVENYDDRNHGAVDLDAALVDSVNTAFAQLGVAVGADGVARVLDRVGVDVADALGPPDRRGPSVALGGLHRGVSPLELASGYGVFATNGLHARPALIAEVTGPRGEMVHRHRPEVRPAVAPEQAAAVRSMLEGAVDEGTGRRAEVDGAPVAGKTGTTQQAADAWFAGVVPGLAAAVWVGHPTGTVEMPDATGGRLAAPLWSAFMEVALGDDPPGEFPAPPPDEEPGGDGLDLPDVERCPEDQCPG